MDYENDFMMMALLIWRQHFFLFHSQRQSAPSTQCHIESLIDIIIFKSYTAGIIRLSIDKFFYIVSFPLSQTIPRLRLVFILLNFN